MPAAGDERLNQMALWSIVAACAALVISSYWIVPLLAGRGYEGSVISTTGEGAIAAYASVPDASLGLVPNLMGLFGFWAETTGRFTSA
jgi:hypothetical protein